MSNNNSLSNIQDELKEDIDATFKDFKELQWLYMCGLAEVTAISQGMEELTKKDVVTQETVLDIKTKMRLLMNVKNDVSAIDFTIEEIFARMNNIMSKTGNEEVDLVQLREECGSNDEDHAPVEIDETAFMQSIAEAMESNHEANNDQANL